MKELFRGFLAFCWEVLKALDWKNVLYKASKLTVLPLIKKLSDNSTSKVDDVIYKGIERLVEVFLAPEQPKLEQPAPVPVVEG